LQTPTGYLEADSAGTARRGHVPQLSISDDGHHVTEAIGHLYGDDDRRDERRLSYMPSPLGETLSVTPASPANANTNAVNVNGKMEPGARLAASSVASSTNNNNNNDTTKNNNTTNNNNNNRNGKRPETLSSRPPLTNSPSFEREPSSPVHLSPVDTANSSFPLNDIDYESDPAAITQELNNLAAIRRMSMDVTGDPDLPSFSNLQVPSVPPSASADENDASRLFWVPARLHPELAPKEFKSFLESKTDQIKRRSSDFSSSLSVASDESAAGLRRKRSMLSRQIDDSNEYTDGADKLERKRSEGQRKQSDSMNPNLHELEEMVDDSKQVNKEALALLGGADRSDMSTTEDKPILPPAPPGHSLKRSTRTQYRKGSLKKGERLPYSKRLGRTPETLGGDPLANAAEDPPVIKPLTRSSTDPGRSISERNAPQQNPVALIDPSKSTALPPDSASSSSFDSMADSKSHQPRHWQSRLSSNGRSTIQLPQSAQTLPQIVETPPPAEPNNNRIQSSNLQQPVVIPERTSSQDTSSSSSSGALPSISVFSKRSASQKHHNSSQTLSDLVSHPAPLPGNTTRTDNLSLIPTFSEDKRSESKKSHKKDSDGSRKSSWPWSRGSDDKEKKKDTESKKSKTKQSAAEKAYDKQDSTRLDVLQSSIDSIPRGRESLVLERPVDQRLEEERRKESSRKSTESKKDKESGLLSSIFGGGKKKSGGDHKKTSSRTLSPEPSTIRQIPDEDYPWSRFNILEERAIYRMAHIKLANPRRPLHSQVLLSNFMYSYLAKVQQMHPQMSIPTSPSQRAQQQQQQSDQPDEYTQYQRYQEVSFSLFSF
jgi:hypothetical protein